MSDEKRLCVHCKDELPPMRRRFCSDWCAKNHKMEDWAESALSDAPVNVHLSNDEEYGLKAPDMKRKAIQP